MNYINVFNDNNETKFKVNISLINVMKNILIDKRILNFNMIVESNYAILSIEGLDDVPTDIFYDLEFTDVNFNRIKVGLDIKGNFPVKLGESHGILSQDKDSILFKHLKLHELFPRIGSAVIEPKYTVIKENNEFYFIKMNNIKGFKSKSLILIERNLINNILNYSMYPILFEGKSFLVPKSKFSNYSLLYFNNSTIFEYPMNDSSQINSINVSESIPKKQTLFSFNHYIYNYLNLNEVFESIDEIPLNEFYFKGNILYIDIPVNYQKLINSNFPILIFNSRVNNDKLVILGALEEENIISFNLDLIINDTIQTRGQWDIYMVGSVFISLYQLSLAPLKTDANLNNYLKIFKYNVEDASIYHVYSRLYFTKGNKIALTKNTESNLIRKQYLINTMITYFSMRKNIINIKLYFESPNLYKMKISKIKLVYRNKKIFKKINSNSIKLIEIKNNRAYIECTFDLLRIDFQFYWDIYASVIIDGNQYLVKVTNVSNNLKEKINNNFSKYQFKLKNNFLVYPYITLNNDLSFMYRKRENYEKTLNYFKENLAYVISIIFKKYYENKEIWIGFEKSANSAHDNGYHFFKYVYNNYKKENFYYVIRKDSPEITNLDEMKDKVLYFMSLKYFIYMFSSKLLISSDTKRNSYNLRVRTTKLGKVLTEKPLFYLQHGVNGLKAVPDFHKKRNMFDLVISPSNYETDLIINNWGYSKDEVVTTGLSRWDALKDLTGKISFRQIFVMPTWRTWMDGIDEESFRNSDFFKYYSELLNSSKLHKIIQENNVRIKFFLHPKFNKYINLFNFHSKNIDRFEYLETSIEEEIMKSSLMITDYSSVIWEMYYLKKPCLFYHFDRKLYLEIEGSYLDFNNDLFGDVAFNSNKMIDLIDFYIRNNFKEKDEFKKMRNKYFSYMDQNNSKRIYNALMNNKKKLYSKKLNNLSIKKLIPKIIKQFINKIR